MRLRTFTARSMQAAMAEVRSALGDDALILSQTTDKRGMVSITAAIEDEPPQKTPTLALPLTRGGNTGAEELTSLLRYHNVPEPLAGRLLYKARQLELESLFSLQKLTGGDRIALEAKALSRLLEGAFRFSPLPVERGLRLMLAGPPGIGKTVAIAKLAAQLAMDKVKLTVITTDTKKAGGVEQLSGFTDILDVPLVVSETAKQLAAALKSVDEHECVLIDTAGCNPYEKADLAELTALIGVGNFEPVLALPAGMDSFEAADAARAFAFPAIRRLLVTRADTARRFGSLLAAADARNLAFAAIGNSPKVVGEIRPLNPALLAQSMLLYRENR